MMRKSLTIIIISLALGFSSCSQTSLDQVVDEKHVSTPAMLSPTDIPGKSEILWARYQSSGDHVYVLGSEEISSRRLPVEMGLFYGYNSHRDEILMAQEFPDRGAGPGGVSVSDLSILNLESGNTQTLTDDFVVKALWSPSGDALAYILATDTTYELHWRTLDGYDRIVSDDVSFTWSIAPSGKAVAFTRESGYELEIKPGLYVVDVDSGEERLIADIDKQGTGSIADQPYWSPDSREVILSHWGGPENPRLILAMADGSGSFDLSIDERSASEWWASNVITELIWDVDNQHVLVVSPVASSEMGEPSPLVYYRLDRDVHRLTDGILLAEVNVLIGWAVPGSSVWVFSLGGEAKQVELP
jgi:hypothetical protein